MYTADLPIILPLVHGEYNFRSHPVGGPYEAVGGALDAGAAEVGELDGAVLGEQDVAGLDVAVDTPEAVQVRQPAHHALADRRDLLLA